MDELWKSNGAKSIEGSRLSDELTVKYSELGWQAEYDEERHAVRGQLFEVLSQNVDQIGDDSLWIFELLKFLKGGQFPVGTNFSKIEDALDADIDATYVSHLIDFRIKQHDGVKFVFEFMEQTRDPLNRFMAALTLAYFDRPDKPSEKGNELESGEDVTVVNAPVFRVDQLQSVVDVLAGSLAVTAVTESDVFDLLFMEKALYALKSALAGGFLDESSIRLIDGFIEKNTRFKSLADLPHQAWSNTFAFTSFMKRSAGFSESSEQSKAIAPGQ